MGVRKIRWISLMKDPIGPILSSNPSLALGYLGYLGARLITTKPRHRSMPFDFTGC